MVFNGTTYTPAALKAGVRPVHHNDFEKAILSFCQAWLSGRQDFPIETSGSTGPPKQIMLHRGQMEASARLTETALGLKEGYTALLCLDPRYIAGQMMLVRAMVTGMKVIAVEPCANPLEKIGDDPIDFSALVPYQLHAILHDPRTRKKLSGFKCVLVGGSALDVPTATSLADLDCRCFASYGMTETITHIALQQLNGPGKQEYFQALDGVKVSTDSRHCLVIRAAHLGDVEIVTNDLVEIQAPGRFRWLGRFDNVINSGGIKIVPEKIERAVGHIFASLHLANRFFVTARPHETLGEHVVLMVEGEMAGTLRTEIMRQLEKLLSRYELPKEITAIARFELTATGKIDRGKTMKNAFAHPDPS